MEIATDFVAEKLGEGVMAVVNILVNGNKAEVDADLDENRNVDCVLHLQDNVKATGYHTGKRVTRFVKNKLCGCLMPSYKLDAHGIGVFDGKTADGELIKYKGTFQDNVFNDVDDNEKAQFFFDGQFKYEGCFKMGKYSGAGTLTNFLDDGEQFVYQKGRFLNGKFKSGKQYIKGKPRCYRMFEGGMEGEEGQDPEEDEGMKDYGGGMKVGGGKVQMAEGDTANVKVLDVADVNANVGGDVVIGTAQKTDPNAKLNYDSKNLKKINVTAGGDFKIDA